MMAGMHAGMLTDSGQVIAAQEVLRQHEGATKRTVAALRKLVENGEIKPDERVVLFNTGTGIKYLEALQAALDLEKADQPSPS